MPKEEPWSNIEVRHVVETVVHAINEKYSGSIGTVLALSQEIKPVKREGVMKQKCCICKKYFDESELYEYRGAIACEEHFDQAQKNRDFKRAEVIAENHHRTDRFRGLDLSGSVIGKANREILKTDIEIAKKQRIN